MERVIGYEKKNEDYFKNVPNIDTIVFKIVTDDNARTLQMQAGELDLALLPPKDAGMFRGNEDHTVYHMMTSDYRGILFHFRNDYWTDNRDIIPAICCSLDRRAILDAVLLGHGIDLTSNLISSIMFMVVMNIRGAIAAESTLSFMGIGLPLEIISWGSMLSLAQGSLLSGSWWIILIYGAFLTAALLCITDIGNSVRGNADSGQSNL